MGFHNAPKAFVFDHTLMMREKVPLRDDLLPGDIGIIQPARRTDEVRGFADHFNAALRRELQGSVREIGVAIDAACNR